MSEVIQFPQRKKQEAESSQDIGPAPTVPTEPAEEVANMLDSSAAMALIAVLAFYANQGWDGGIKARRVMPALQQLLASKGIALVLPT